MSFRLPVSAVFFAALSLVSSLGCAVASEDIDVGDGGKKKDTGAVLDETGDDDTGGGDDAVFTDTSTTDSSTVTDSSGTDGTPPSDTGMSEETGKPCTVLGPSDCAAGPTDIGAVSGDTGSDVVTATGVDNQFLKVKVTENDSSLFSGKDLHFTVTLSSTPPSNFDLYIYMGTTAANGGSVECSSVSDSSTATSADDVIGKTITDHHPIGGSDDTTWVTIEVRSATPICSGAAWNLKVEGNK